MATDEPHDLFYVENWRSDAGINSDEWEITLRADPCAYCGEASSTVDHIVPTSTIEKGTYGRSSVKMNGTGACDKCNVAKSHTSLLLYLHARNDPVQLAPRRENRSERFKKTFFFTVEQIEEMRRAC